MNKLTASLIHVFNVSIVGQFPNIRVGSLNLNATFSFFFYILSDTEPNINLSNLKLACCLRSPQCIV